MPLKFNVLELGSVLQGKEHGTRKNFHSPLFEAEISRQKRKPTSFWLSWLRAGEFDEGNSE